MNSVLFVVKKYQVIVFEVFDKFSNWIRIRNSFSFFYSMMLELEFFEVFYSAG